MQIGGVYTIDFAKISKIPRFSVNIKTRDSKRTIKLILLKNNEVLNLNNYTVVVAAKKADRKDIFNDVKIIDALAGICEVEITEQMLALDMDLPCEIVLYNADGVVASSSSFVINKISSLRNEESIVSSSEFTALTKALSEVKGIDITYRKNSIPIKMKDLDTDVKEAMTGGSVPVVGVDAVGNENLKTNSVDLDNVVENLFTRVKKQGNIFLNSLNPTKLSDVFMKMTGGGDGDCNIVEDNVSFAKYDVDRYLHLTRKNATNQYSFKLCSEGKNLVDITEFGITTDDTISFGAIMKSSDTDAKLMLYQYDSEKNYIKGSGVFTSNIGQSDTIKHVKSTATIKSNAKFVELVVFGTDTLSEMVTFDIAHWYVKKGIADNAIYLNNKELNYVLDEDFNYKSNMIALNIADKIIEDEILIPSANLFNKDGVLLDGYVFTDGKIFGSGTYVHQVIRVNEGETYRTKYSINVAFLDSLGNFAYAMPGGEMSEGLFTVPVGLNIAYITLTTLKSDLNIQYLIKGSDKPHSTPVFKKKFKDFIELSEQQKNSINLHPWKGKKLLILGDSITAIGIDPRGWLKYFSEILKPSSLINVAVSASTWRDKEGTVYDGNPVTNGQDNNVNNVIGNQVQKILNNNYEAPDVIMIAAGTNDSYENVTDDNIELQFFKDGENVSLPNVDRKTWAGAIRYTVETLREKYPNAQIFLCTPVQRCNPGLNTYPTIKTKGEIIKKLGLRMSVPVIDSAECGVYGMYAVDGKPTLDHNDGLHLSATGATKLGIYNARKIINWFCF